MGSPHFGKHVNFQGEQDNQTWICMQFIRNLTGTFSVVRKYRIVACSIRNTSDSISVLFDLTTAKLAFQEFLAFNKEEIKVKESHYRP